MSPCVGVAVAAQGQRMIGSAADLCVGEVRGRACRLLHFDRCRPGGSVVRPVADLAFAVFSPCVGVAVAAQGQRMPTSGADLHVGEIHRCVCRLRHRGGRVPLVGLVDAELAIVVASPCPGVAVAAHSQ